MASSAEENDRGLSWFILKTTTSYLGLCLKTTTRNLGLCLIQLPGIKITPGIMVHV